jgi:hypothetical protein
VVRSGHASGQLVGFLLLCLVCAFYTIPLSVISFVANLSVVWSFAPRRCSLYCSVAKCAIIPDPGLDSNPSNLGVEESEHFHTRQWCASSRHIRLLRLDSTQDNAAFGQVSRSSMCIAASQTNRYLTCCAYSSPVRVSTAQSSHAISAS